MLSKRTILSSLAALALAGGVVAQTSAPALAWRHHHHHDNDAAIAIGAGALGLALGATLLAPRNVYYDDGYYDDDYDAPPPPRYRPRRIYLEGPYPPPPRVYETRRGHVARCLARYRSYDPRTDTFMGYDGRPHYCRL
jgi:hypothetical protein